MSTKSPSPFAALDTNLLRETQGDGAEGSGGRKARRGRAEAPADPVAATQRALRTTGKEIFYARITPDEKQRVADLIHEFSQRGVRLTVNEIGRIALNQLFAEYEARGAESFLARVLAERLP